MKVSHIEVFDLAAGLDQPVWRVTPDEPSTEPRVGHVTLGVPPDGMKVEQGVSWRPSGGEDLAVNVLGPGPVLMVAEFRVRELPEGQVWSDGRVIPMSELPWDCDLRPA